MSADRTSLSRHRGPYDCDSGDECSTVKLEVAGMDVDCGRTVLSQKIQRLALLPSSSCSLSSTSAFDRSQSIFSTITNNQQPTINQQKQQPSATISNMLGFADSDYPVEYFHWHELPPTLRGTPQAVFHASPPSHILAHAFRLICHHSDCHKGKATASHGRLMSKNLISSRYRGKLQHWLVVADASAGGLRGP